MKNILHKALLFCTLFGGCTVSFAQVGIGTTTPHHRAILDLQNNGAYRGLQVPQVGTGGRTAMAADLSDAHVGMIVADTSAATGGFYVWGGTQWLPVGVGESLWERATGKTYLENGTDNVGIGNDNPQHRLHIGDLTADGQGVMLRTYHNSGSWKGGAAFGHDQAAVIIGQQGGVANIGGHNSTLTAWADLVLNQGGGNVGIGTNAPTAKLHVAGSLRLTNGTEAAGRVLTSAADGTASWAPEADPKVGNLAVNRVPRWAGTSLQDSPIRISGNFVGVGRTPANLFEVGEVGSYTTDVNQSSTNSTTSMLAAQSFRPTVSGLLAGFELLLGGAAGDVLGIQLHQGENPTTPNPLTGVTTYTLTTGSFIWTQVLFAAPVPVTAGQDYHIVLSLVSGSPNFQLSSANPYPNGRFFYNFGFWQPFSSTDDLGFRTLMAVENTFVTVQNSTGNMGIGTTSPTARLHLNGSFRLTNGTEAVGYLLTSDASGNATWQAPPTPPTTGWTKAGSVVHLAVPTDYVGIGTAAPTAPLEVGMAGSGHLRVGPRQTWGGATHPTLYSSNASEYIMLHAPHLPYLQSGQNGYTAGSQGARVRMAAADNAASYWDVGVPNYVGVDKFAIGRNETPFMVIANDGKLGLGTTNPQHLFAMGNTSDWQNVNMRVYGDNGYGWKGSAAFGFSTATVIMGEQAGVACIGGHNGDLSAWRNLALNPGGGYVGVNTFFPDFPLTVNGQIKASCGIVSCSDERYKHSIQPLDHALASLLKLNGVVYHWRTSEFPDMGFSADRQLGVIAQNVETLYPEAVVTASSGYKSVDYTKLVPVLIEALKEEHGQRTQGEQQLMRLIQELADQNRDLQLQLQQLKEQLGLPAQDKAQAR